MQSKTTQPAMPALAPLARFERTESGEERLSLDLRDVERADSALMARIVILAGTCRARGMRLRLVGSESVVAWLELCQLDGLVEVAAAA
jgi:anti-anti-sigma regulatory factor